MKLSWLLALLMISSGYCPGQKPWPYKPGVAENYTGVIHSTDPSAFERMTYLGQREETVFDWRVNNGKGGRTDIKAYIFKITWSDRLSSEMHVNPDIGDFKTVTSQAEKHAGMLGRLPHCLRSLVDRIVLHGGDAQLGGGNRGLLLYAERTARHEYQKGKLNEIMVHEAAHNLAQIMGKSAGWVAAQNRDGAFISKYAQDFPQREDVSESFLAWLILRYHRNRITGNQANIISHQIPARLKYFDDQCYDISPLAVAGVSSIHPAKPDHPGEGPP